MISAAAESRSWPSLRWLLLITFVFCVQVGLIFWLGAQNTETPPTPVAGLAIYLPADQTGDLPGVSDPTLFVLPASHSFSESAWMRFPTTTYQLEAWTEPARPLPLAIPQLGATLAEFVRANQSRPFELALLPPPEVDAFGDLPLGEAPSTYSVQGELAGRELLTPMKLPSWPAPEILKDTEVQIAVDATGRVISSAVISPSASADANTYALNLARSNRFAPLRWIEARPPPPGPGGLVWGKIVFHWHTDGPTNSAAPSTK